MKDFELLVSLGVFNDSLMNDAVYKLKRYEDTSLSYTGINRREGENHGGWDTVISDEDYNSMFALQQASMEALKPAEDDVPEKPFFTDSEETVAPPLRKEPLRENEREIPERKSLYRAPLQRPAYTPPVPEPVETKPEQKIDLSSIKAGSFLKHKAFGLGTVKEISGGLIVVMFGTAEKKFQFPGALIQGFLQMTE